MVNTIATMMVMRGTHVAVATMMELMVTTTLTRREWVRTLQRMAIREVGGNAKRRVDVPGALGVLSVFKHEADRFVGEKQ